MYVCVYVRTYVQVFLMPHAVPHMSRLTCLACASLCIETVDARKAMMVACVKRIYTHGLKCPNADITRKWDPEDVKDWFRRDFILSWRKREATRSDMHRFMAEQVKPAVANFEQLRSERAPSTAAQAFYPKRGRLKSLHDVC